MPGCVAARSKIMKCPRQDPQNLNPDDIFETDCPQCGATVEFWEGDSIAKCPQCKAEIKNPHIEGEEKS
jgi:hypothetical protein